MSSGSKKPAKAAQLTATVLCSSSRSILVELPVSNLVESRFRLVLEPAKGELLQLIGKPWLTLRLCVASGQEQRVAPAVFSIDARDRFTLLAGDKQFTAKGYERAVALKVFEHGLLHTDGKVNHVRLLYPPIEGKVRCDDIALVIQRGRVFLVCDHRSFSCYSSSGGSYAMPTINVPTGYVEGLRQAFGSSSRFQLSPQPAWRTPVEPPKMVEGTGRVLWFSTRIQRGSALLSDGRTARVQSASIVAENPAVFSFLHDHSSVTYAAVVPVTGSSPDGFKFDLRGVRSAKDAKRHPAASVVRGTPITQAAS